MPHSHALTFAQQSDDDAKDTFANVMRDRMGLGRAKGREDWQTWPVDTLWQMLREHVDTGDPVAVAILAMMIHSHSPGRG